MVFSGISSGSPGNEEEVFGEVILVRLGSCLWFSGLVLMSTQHLAWGEKKLGLEHPKNQFISFGQIPKPPPGPGPPNK